MPSSYNGIGTKYYGASDRQPDGSFVTTEWVILVNVPLIPLRSQRVTYLGESREGRNSTKLYNIVADVPLDKKLVVTTYILLLVPLLFGCILMSSIAAGNDASGGASSLCAPVALAMMAFWVIVYPLIYKAQ
ncbi:MAG: hypothetical protein JW934_05485 [Anaerolineae bacterium]|nr:hypothetical protein [Anaerolineae bacterium]